MSYLQRIANLVAGSANPPAGAVPSGAGPFAVGHFLQRRSARFVHSAAAPGFAVDGAMESNSFGPEAGRDSALVAQNPVGVHRGDSTARHPVFEPRRRDGSSKQRGFEKLVVDRRSSDVLTPSSNLDQRSERFESDTDAKNLSERGAGKTVHANSPSLRPAHPFPVPAHDAALRETEAGSTSGQSAPTPSPAGSPPLAAQDRAASAIARHVASGDAAPGGGITQSRGEHRATSAARDVPAHAAQSMDVSDARARPEITAEQRAAAPAPRVSVELPASDPRPDHEAPAFTTVYSVSATPERSTNPSSAPTVEALVTARRPRESATDRIGEPASPQPAVHIGSIEIIVEAPAEPRATASAPAPTADFSSRHYLRGL